MSLQDTDAYPPPLSGLFKDSFAYATLSQRLPVIITKVIDFLCRQRKVIPVQLSVPVDCLHLAEEETKSLIDNLARLKYELQTNKPLKIIYSDLSDTEEWNKFFIEESAKNEDVTFFNVSWLYAECYFYRQMRQIFADSKYLTNFDPFSSIKQNSFISSLKDANLLATKLINVDNPLDIKTFDQFNFFVMTSLWGNKYDLSISCGELNKRSEETFDDLEIKILINDINFFWSYVNELSKSGKSMYQIDIVLDNAGYELLTDLCLVEFFHSVGLFPKDKCSVKFHLKKMPWFVSDTMKPDFDWMLDFISENNECSTDLKQINNRFKENLDANVWFIEEHDFWTLPYDYSQMPNVAPQLYKNLSQSDLVIFKGDLNYRKLVGDLKWDFLTKFKDSLRQFQPQTAFCSMRTIKADVVVGLNKSTVEKINTSFEDNWMERGEYAVINFVNNK